MRMPLSERRSMMCDAAAEVVLRSGIDRLSPATVSARSGISRGRVARVYKNRDELAAGLYSEGRARIEAVCSVHEDAAGSGTAALISLVYALVDQAADDPVVRVLHTLESTGHAAAPDDIYSLWRRSVTTLLLSGTQDQSGRSIDRRDDEVSDVAELLVGAVAGFSDPFRFDCDRAATYDRVHMMLTALLPALSVDSASADGVRRYLRRVRLTLEPYGAVLHSNPHVVRS
jgi:AcrR family transcriptional regulator